MAALLLLDALDKLSTKDMGRFHFHLKLKMVDGCKPITTQRLEDQDRGGTVTVMIDQYGDDLAVKVTDVILEKMGFNNIRRQLTSAYEEGRSAASSSSSSSSSSASAAPPAPITMTAQQESTMINPILNSSKVETMNIYYNKP